MKKKILLLSDDLRMHSGVAVMSKEIVFGSLNHYDWVQLGGAIKHPENGKIIDMAPAVEKELNIKNPYLKIYPTDGYGNPDLLREIINMEKPDAILHYTDPRFWIWLYNMEEELRQKMPIFFYTIWDDYPAPMYNSGYYNSCDLLMAISKQSYNIVNKVAPQLEDWQTTYVPHGINTKKFFPVSEVNVDYRNFSSQFGLDKYKFKILYLNRNIRRKQPGDVALAYKQFVNSLPEDKRKEAVLVWHTAPVDDNGTDLPRLCKHLLPECNVIFTYKINNGPFDDVQLNFLYNACDMYINLASNEGFGLGSAQALMVGKPILVNVTGGLQDQCGFKLKDKYLTEEDYLDIESLHEEEVWKNNEDLTYGSWAFPVWPTNRSLQGSPPTPYIFDDRCKFTHAADQIMNIYNLTPEQKETIANDARAFVNDPAVGMEAQNMANRFIKDMDNAFKHWKPKQHFILEQVA